MIDLANSSMVDENGEVQGPVGEALMQHHSELQGIPSSSLKDVIQEAKNALNPSSEFLKDTLIRAGLLEEQSGHEIAPWERSKTFNDNQEYLHPGHHNPKVGGVTIRLGNPQSHEILVKHCKDCVGALTMCYTWNDRVEQALHYHQEGNLRFSYF